MAELQRAFISSDMIAVDEQLIQAVVTAGRWPEDGLVITIRPVEPPAALASLTVVIDERDLAEVQKLLGEKHQMLLDPDEDLDALGMALTALHEIADLDQIKEEQNDWTWKDVAMRCIDYAQEALAEIEFLQEANDGTPSDS